MKKLSKIAAVALFGFAALGASVANAAPVAGTFDVTINLTPSCSVSNGTAVVLDYTSFGAAQSGTSSVNILCTNTLPYTAALSGVTTIAGIAFTVAPAVAFPTAGTGTVQAVVLNVNAVAGQAGTCAAPAGCTGTEQQTLTITY